MPGVPSALLPSFMSRVKTELCELVGRRAFFFFFFPVVLRNRLIRIQTANNQQGVRSWMVSAGDTDM